MNTRSLAARLKRLEFRSRPEWELPRMVICVVDSKARVLYKIRLGTPENQYFAPDDHSMSKEEAHRLWAASDADEGSLAGAERSRLPSGLATDIPC